MRKFGWPALVGLGVLGVFAELSACGTRGEGTGDGQVTSSKNALDTLQSAFPAAKVITANGRVTRVFGAPLTTGATPTDAAEQFRRVHAASLGIPASELVPQEVRQGQAVPVAAPAPLGLMYDSKSGQYKFWLYRYGQSKAGVPVFRSGLRTLVRNEGNHPVVWASSTVHDLSSFSAPSSVRAPIADLDKSLRAMRGSSGSVGQTLPPAQAISRLSAATMVVFAGNEGEDLPPRLAFEYTAETVNPPQTWRMVADAANGDVLHAESVIVFEDVTGTVTGNATQGAKSMDCADEVPTKFPYAEVTGGSASVFTNTLGNFVLPNAGSTALDLTSFPGGQFFDVVNAAGATEQLLASTVPPGPASFLHNPDNASDLLRAQANGYLSANQVRDFLLKYHPNYPTISTQLNFPVNVNRSDVLCPGNAWYDGSSINFCVGSASFGNTAFASVAYHEYGHHIVSSGGSGQGAYGEGMGDTVSALLAADPGLGFGFFLNQCTTPLRNADNTCQFSASVCSSCGSEVHACGNLLSGTIWSIRKELAVTQPETFADLINALVINSVPLHTGTGIDSTIAIDLLTLDDTDADLGNGTPHYKEICAGFAAHGMTCPPLLTGLTVTPSATLSASGPVGGPFAPDTVSYTLKNLGPTPAVSYSVSPLVPAPWLSIANSSGQLAVGQQAQVTVAIDAAAAAALAKGKYAATLQFVNLTDGVGGGARDVQLEVGVPTPIFAENFSGGLGGFSVGSESNNRWHVTSGCASSLAGHSAPSSLYFGVEGACNFDSGTISAGTATSPGISVADTSIVKLRFNYFLQTERLSSFDRATVQVSVNQGAFSTVASNNTGGQALVDGSGIWQESEVDLSSLFAGATSANIRLRFGFDSVDSILNAFTGFLVDDVELRAFAVPCSTSAECDDGAFCNGSEQCLSGSCAPGTPFNCNDGVACTQDACDEAQDACTHQASNGACNDGQACNGIEVCNPTLGCQAGTPLDCSDNNACTADSCSATLGCQHSTVSCDDGSACTTDSCDASLGCQHAAVSCSDGNACTTDSCDASLGCLHGAVSCDDGSACTTDSCDASLGCQHAAVSCDDGSACTTDSCSATLGCQHGPVSCDDGNVCTLDSCNVALGCQHANSSGSCPDDGNACTSDVCSAGACTHPSNGTCSSGAFLESGGQVVIEAEHFSTNAPRASHTWDLASNSTASGGQWMESNPNNGGNINTGFVTGSPQLSFPIKFTTTGTYQVWVRGSGVGTADRTCHAGIDGTGPTSSDRISGFSAILAWSKSTLDGPVATITISTAGVHTFNLWMREDGFRVDKLLLTTNVGLLPSGAGPAESARGQGCTTSSTCNDSNPCTQDSCVSGTCQNSPVAAGGSCGDDGNVCTNDVCGSTGTCTHPNNTTSCTDDGSSCTNDVCSNGACTHPSNGTCGGSSPCANFCATPTPFSGPFQSGNLGANATCHQTTGPINGGNCGNFVSPRSLSVNGTPMTCNNGNWPTLPAKVNGGYCITTTAGNQPWAFFTTW